MNKQRIREVLIICAAVIGLVLIIVVIMSNPMVRYNNYMLKEAVVNLDSKKICVNQVVPFEWHTVYAFKPYTSKEIIEGTLGIESSVIEPTMDDDMVQYIFVKNNRVVSSICDEDTKLGYRIEFKGLIKAEDKVEFTVKKNDGVIVLK